MWFQHLKSLGGTEFRISCPALLSNTLPIVLGNVDADGKKGNEEGAPYDAIHVGAAAKGKLSFCRGIMLLLSCPILESSNAFHQEGFPPQEIGYGGECVWMWVRLP